MTDWTPRQEKTVVRFLLNLFLSGFGIGALVGVLLGFVIGRL